MKVCSQPTSIAGTFTDWQHTDSIRTGNITCPIRNTRGMARTGQIRDAAGGPTSEIRGAGVGMGRGPSLGAKSPTVLRASTTLVRLPPGPDEASVKVEQGRCRAWRVAGAVMIGLL